MIERMREGLRFGVARGINPPTGRALVPHRDVPPAELGRPRLARCVVGDGRPPHGAAERFQAAVTVAGRMPDVAGQNP